MSKHQPAEFTITIIPGEEPLSDYAIKRVAHILLDSFRERMERKGGNSVTQYHNALHRPDHSNR